jgi:hypothetical protein
MTKQRFWQKWHDSLRKRFFLWTVSVSLRWREFCIRQNKPRLMQFHLSTSVLMMLIAGLVFGLNAQMKRSPDYFCYGFPFSDIRIPYRRFSLKGSNDEDTVAASIQERFEHKPVSIEYRPGVFVQVVSEKHRFIWLGVIFNIAFLVMAVLFVAVLCEWKIREAPNS